MRITDPGAVPDVEAYLLRYLKALRRGKPAPAPPATLLDKLGRDGAVSLRLQARRVEEVVASEAREIMRRRHQSGPAPHDAQPAPDFPDLGDYRPLEVLGRGRFGTVYRAADRHLPGRYVAVKVMHRAIPDTPLDDRRWELTFGEARKSAILDHPHIVRYLDHGIARDGTGGRRAYIVMEWIDGETLDSRIERDLHAIAAGGNAASRRRSSWRAHQRRMAEVLLPIAEATHAAHLGRPERGLVGCQHCDIKPRNIVVDVRGKPYLTDFGLARDRNAPGPLGGTKGYMSPEMRVPGYPVGPTMDVYGLGATLHHGLVGGPPDDPPGGAAASPARIRKIEKDLDAIRRKCLHPDPKDRYQTADEVADDLRRWLGGRPVAARPASPFERTWRWCRRRPAVASLAVALALTLVGSFAGLLALLWRSEAQRSHAEVNYRVAARSLDTLLKELTKDYRPLHFKKFYDRDLLNKLESVRSQETELSGRHPPDAPGLRRSSWLDSSLARLKMLDGKRDESLSLMEESLDLLEAALARGAAETEILPKMIEHAVWTLGTLRDPVNDHLYQRWQTRALAMLERLKPHHRAYAAELCRFSRERRHHAYALIRCGESDRARKELEEDLKRLDSLGDVEKRTPEIRFCEVLALAPLGRWSGEFLVDPSPPPSGQQASDFGRFLGDLAELGARRIGWLPSIIESPPLIQGPPSAEGWADRVIAAMRGDAARLAFDPHWIPATCWTMNHHASNLMARQRRVGKLTDARRVADEVVALAEGVIRQYSNQCYGHMALSEGYIQKMKNAYRDEDSIAVDRYIRMACEEAIRAAQLEPENDEARARLQDCRARYLKYESEKK